MKGLYNYLQKKVKPAFLEGGKLSKFYVVYDGLETFLFVPPHTTQKGSHIRDGIDLKRAMFMVVVALIPALLFGTFNLGHQYMLATGEITQATPVMEFFWQKLGLGAMKVVPLIVVSYGVGLGIEFIYAGMRGHGINEGFLVSGMLIPLVLPPNIPLVWVGIAVAFAVVIGKEIFGGTGMNILNVALLTRAFLFFSYPTKMTGSIWIMDGDTPMADGHTGATILGSLSETVTKGHGSPEAISAVNSLMEGGQYSMSNLFYGLIPGSIGETSALACLIGAVFLLFVGIASWRIMTSFFVGGLVMAFLFQLWGANPFMAVDPIQQLLMGGFMFGMVFMITDPVTATQTNRGKYIYGFFAGFLGIMIRVFNPAFPEGIMMAILFMNVMAPLIDHYVIESNIKKRLKRVAAKA